MTIRSYAVTGARAVRVGALVVAVALLVALIALQTFASRYGGSTDAATFQPGASDVRLSAAIAEQESAGRRCSGRPALTDVVLFQRSATGTVSVLSFDRAIAASMAGTGWIRRFCV